MRPTVDHGLSARCKPLTKRALSGPTLCIRPNRLTAVAAAGYFNPRPQTPDPHRIQVQVAGYLDCPFRVLDQEGAEATLEKVAAKTMGPVEDTAVGNLEPPDGIAEVGILNAEQEMVVVVHQDEGVNLCAELFVTPLELSACMTQTCG